MRLDNLKEGSEAGGGLISCVQKFIAGFGFDDVHEFEIERTRTSLTMPGENRPPITVLIRYQRSSPGLRYLKRRKKGVAFSGKATGCLFPPDLFKELEMKRKKFATAKKQLHEQVRHPLQVIFCSIKDSSVMIDSSEKQREIPSCFCFILG